MKIIKKIGLVILVFAIFNCYFTITANASNPITSSGQIINAASSFTAKGAQQANGVSANGVTDAIKVVASVIASLGIFVLAISTLVLGIQYLTASPQRQAALRAQMVGLLWAAVVILGAYGIWNAAVAIASTF